MVWLRINSLRVPGLPGMGLEHFGEGSAIRSGLNGRIWEVSAASFLRRSGNLATDAHVTNLRIVPRSLPIRDAYPCTIEHELSVRLVSLLLGKPIAGDDDVHDCIQRE
jgi:hypothetical protein